LKAGKDQEAREIFASALTSDPTNKKFLVLMLFNLGLADLKLKRFQDAFNDLSEALKIDENHAKALHYRAQVHFELKEFDDCVIDCEASIKLRPAEDVKKLLAEAIKSLKFQSNRSCWEVMGLTSSASSSQVKKKYRELSLLYHPDKHPDATAVEVKKFERKFRVVKEAYDKCLNN
jgi:DnaJ homolog subfamily C member 7